MKAKNHIFLFIPILVGLVAVVVVQQFGMLGGGPVSPLPPPPDPLETTARPDPDPDAPGRPLTATLRPGRTLSKYIAGVREGGQRVGGQPLLELHVEGVDFAAGWPAAEARVFLNRPDATAQTSDDDPRLVGTFSPGPTDGRVQSVILNPADALRFTGPGGPGVLTVTVVGVSADGTETIRLPFARATLSAIH